MAFDIDGLAVLRGMSENPETFAGVEAEAAKVARALLTKSLKDRAVTLARARAMAAVLPSGTLAHITDAMADTEVSALATRFDKLNPALKSADRLAKATLIADLISGAVEPATGNTARSGKAVAQQRVTRKAPSSGVEAAKKVILSKAMGARKASGKAAGT